jgi:hypothetical protein
MKIMMRGQREKRYCPEEQFSASLSWEARILDLLGTPPTEQSSEGDNCFEYIPALFSSAIDWPHFMSRRSTSVTD